MTALERLSMMLQISKAFVLYINPQLSPESICGALGENLPIPSVIASRHGEIGQEVPVRRPRRAPPETKTPGRGRGSGRIFLRGKPFQGTRGWVGLGGLRFAWLLARPGARTRPK